MDRPARGVSVPAMCHGPVHAARQLEVSCSCITLLVAAPVCSIHAPQSCSSIMLLCSALLSCSCIKRTIRLEVCLSVCDHLAWSCHGPVHAARPP